MAAKKPEPNKYLKNKDIRPNSLVGTLLSLLNFGLMILGIAGIGVHVFSNGGLGGKLLSKLFESTSSMMMIPVIGLILFLLNRFLTAPTQSKTSSKGDLPMYLMVGLGGFFLFRLMTTGEF